MRFEMLGLIFGGAALLVVSFFALSDSLTMLSTSSASIDSSNLVYHSSGIVDTEVAVLGDQTHSGESVAQDLLNVYREQAKNIER